MNRLQSCDSGDPSSDLERYLSQSRLLPSSASGGFEHLRRFPAVVVQQGLRCYRRFGTSSMGISLLDRGA